MKEAATLGIRASLLPLQFGQRLRIPYLQMGPVADDRHLAGQTQFFDALRREQYPPLRVRLHEILVLIDETSAPAVGFTIERVERFYEAGVVFIPRVRVIDADAWFSVLEADKDGTVSEVLPIAGRKSHSPFGIKGVIEGA
jgi:hypothetical protein